MGTRTVTENKTVTNVISKMDGNEDEQSLEQILDKVKKTDNTCDYKGCKQKINLMGHTCDHCKLRYCMKHSLAEVHGKFTGCDEAIRKKEREEFLHPKVDTRKMQHQVQHDKAKKTLSSKLKQMELERKAKPSAGGAGGSSSKKKK